MTTGDNYEPGTVVIATVRGEPDVRVLRIAKREDGSGFGWVGGLRAAGNVGYFDHEVTDIRPLVVLDLALGDARPEDFAHMLRQSGPHPYLDHIADQIVAQAMPRIPEPGLWGVVEASYVNGRRRRWLHTDLGHWISDIGTPADWEKLDNPVLLREGV